MSLPSYSVEKVNPFQRPKLLKIRTNQYTPVGNLPTQEDSAKIIIGKYNTLEDSFRNIDNSSQVDQSNQTIKSESSAYSDEPTKFRHQCVQKNEKRVKAWFEKIMSNKKLINCMVKGVIDVDRTNPKNYQYRTRKKKLEERICGDSEFICKSANERSIFKSKCGSSSNSGMDSYGDDPLGSSSIMHNDSIEKEHSMYIKRDPWNELGKYNDFELRTRHPDLEISGNIRYSGFCDEDKIHEQKKNNKILDYSPRDITMIGKYPKWRDDQKKKWTTKKGFFCQVGKLTNKNFRYKKVDVKKEYAIDKYLGSHEEVSNAYLFNMQPSVLKDVHIPALDQDKAMEHDNSFNRTSGHFIPYNRNDIWESCLHVSQSLRTGLNDNMMDYESASNNFNENDYILKYYKKALVKTNNVDKIIPFKVSHNYRGVDYTTMRPNYEKTYPKSTDVAISRSYNEENKCLNSNIRRYKQNKKIQSRK